jgi:hypothetical protein
MTNKPPKDTLAHPEEASADAAPARPKQQPIGTVRRTLVRPDGTKVAVDVPIYAPFRLENGEPAPQTKPPRRARPGVKPKPTGSD